MSEEYLASDNPAVTEPASHKLSGSPRTTQTTQNGGITVTDPTGAEKKLPTTDSKNRPMPTKYDVGWRRIVRNFSPSWFSVTMGTGIVAVLLISIPYPSKWLYWLSIVFFVLNTALFSLALLTSIIRYTVYPEIWIVMINDPVNSLFLGTIPMGFATLIEMWVYICVPAWGPWAITFVWVMWMIDAVVAAAVTAFLSFTLMSSGSQITLSRITAAQLLPIAATIVAAGTGAEVAEILPNPHHALGTIITGYVMWGMGVPLALTIIVIYYQRLAVHKLPPREIIVSCFLPLGPLGFGGFTIMYLGKVARHVLPTTSSLDPLAGSVAYILGFFVALVMWGFGVMWLIFALATIYKCKPFPFNMGWWGFTFPLGVFAASTIQLGQELPGAFFKVLGTIFTCAVILLWIVVAAGTARGAWSGKLFYAPCLANLKRAREEDERAAAAAAEDDGKIV